MENTKPKTKLQALNELEIKQLKFEIENKEKIYNVIFWILIMIWLILFRVLNILNKKYD